MTVTNQTRRNIMLMAWDFRRTEPSRSFADCLRGAWKWTKGMAKTAAKFMARAARNGGRLNLSPSLIKSPATNRHAGTTYGRTHDRWQGASISRLGR